MKDCEKIHPLLPFYIEGELTPVEKGRIDQHLKVCSEARQELEKYKSLLSASRSMPEPQAPRDLHEKIMARVVGKIFPIRSQRPLWVFPAWGLATAACLSIFLLIQNPDLLTFNRQKTTVPPEETNMTSSVPSAPKAFSSVPVKSAGSAEKEKLQTNAKDENLDKTRRSIDSKVAPQNFAASEEMRPSAPQTAVLKHAEKKVREKNAAFPMADKPANFFGAGSANLQAQTGANRILAQGASTGKNDDLEIANGTTSAAAPAPALAQPIPNPTEGSLATLSYSKQITASQWTGNNAPATVETGELVTEGALFKQNWQQLRPGEEAPQVDFTTQAVVFLIGNEEPTAGYAIHVSNLEEKTDQLVIHYQVEAPASGSVEAQIITHPWSMQVIPKPTKPFVFEKDSN